MDVFLTVRLLIEVFICSVAGTHAYYVHRLESEKSISAQRIVFLVYSVILGIVSAIGFGFFCLCLVLDKMKVFTGTYEAFWAMFVIAYLFLAAGISHRSTNS